MLLEKLQNALSSKSANVKSGEKRDQDEYAQYTQEMEETLRNLEAQLHESDDPEEIALSTLKAACKFYDGDWCGVLDVDLDLGLWMPFWWYNKNPEDKTAVLLDEFESSEFLYRWVAAIKAGQAIIVPDCEEIKVSYPDEYAMYQRIGIKSVIGVPFWKRPTGFLAVRNPKRYVNRSSMLQLLAFVVVASVNEKKLMDSARMVLSPDDIKNDTDIIIHLFGELKIYTSKGILQEADIKSPKICRLVAYLLLHQRSMIPPREIAEAIWPEEACDSDNPGKNLKGLIYRFRQMFSLISDYQLIESTPNGYRLNPKLNIMTDLQQFDRYWDAAQKAISVTDKVSLLKKTVAVYTGNVLASAASEHWLMHTASHYNLKYLGVINELLKTLAEVNDYSEIHLYATQSLSIEPGNMRAYYWLIYAMYRMGATEMAKSEVKEAERYLTREEYLELIRYLRQLKGIPFDIKTSKLIL